MMITPLVLHAAARLPSVTSAFSDPLSAASIDVVAGSLSTINLSSPVSATAGSEIAVVIVSAPVPNPIVAVVSNNDGTLTVETEYDHDQTEDWSGTVRLGGFAESTLNQALSIVAVPDRRLVTVRPLVPPGAVALTGNEVLLEELERALTGWRRVTVLSSTELTFSTPTSVARNMTIDDPAIVASPRIFGALDLEEVVRKFVKGNDYVVDARYLFVTPLDRSTLSRDRRAKSDAVAELSVGADYRRLLVDGFECFIVVPSEPHSGGVAAIDFCQGAGFHAVLKAFHGLRVPPHTAFEGENFVSVFRQHGVAFFNKAIYVHRYSFESPVYLTAAQAIEPFEWSDILMDAADPDTIDHIGRVGGVAFRELGMGLQHDGKPEKLTATANLD